MVNYLLGTLGIVVSVALFLVGYRQTIGARKERTAAANTDLERILSRRVILESFSPTRDEIDRLREGKSREYRIALPDMLLPIELMNTVYTRLIENDFISPDLRKEITERINPLFEKLSKSEGPEVEPVQERFARSALPVLLAILTSALGAAVAVIPQFRSTALGRREAIELLIVTATVSFAIIATYLLFTRLRDEQEESLPRSIALNSALEFERAVASAIRRAGLLVMQPPAPSGYDLQVTTQAGVKILVEVKMWARRVPSMMLRALVERLSARVAEEGAKEALIVVREPLVLPRDLIGDAPVKVLSFRELRNYLRGDIAR